MEEWREIPEYEGCYEASSLGNIRSMERESISYGTRLCKRQMRILAPNNAGRYQTVTLSKAGIIKTRTVHSLVVAAFLTNPDGLPQIDHIDRNKKNNCLSNLRWVTREENQANRGICRHNTSGEPHIQIRPNGEYRLNISRKSLRVNKWFKTLDEAKAYRLEVLGF